MPASSPRSSGSAPVSRRCRAAWPRTRFAMTSPIRRPPMPGLRHLERHGPLAESRRHPDRLVRRRTKVDQRSRTAPPHRRGPPEGPRARLVRAGPCRRAARRRRGGTRAPRRPAGARPTATTRRPPRAPPAPGPPARASPRRGPRGAARCRRRARDGPAARTAACSGRPRRRAWAAPSGVGTHPDPSSSPRGPRRCGSASASAREREAGEIDRATIGRRRALGLRRRQDDQHGAILGRRSRQV